MGETGWTRRELTGGAALLAAIVGVPAMVATLSRQDDTGTPSDRQRAMLREVSQLVIPRTATPGAGEVGVGDFVTLALAHGLDGTRKPVATDAMPPLVAQHRRSDGSLDHIGWLEATLDRAANGDWPGKPVARRAAILARLDAEAFATPGPHPWKKVKALILTGYYTSQTGGARELQYEATPGRFDPAVAVKPDARGYSSDWTGVEFG